MSARGSLVRRCRDLEARCIRINHQIGIDWARQWADALLDTRTPPSLYENWIDQLDAWVSRKEERLAA